MLLNKTKRTTLSKDFTICDNSKSKAIGLMFSRNPKTLIFVFRNEKRYSLHMLFVFYSIDVLFLDKRKKVVDLKKKFLPFAFYRPKHKAKYIIELKEGTIKKSRTVIGDQVSF